MTYTTQLTGRGASLGFQIMTMTLVGFVMLLLLSSSVQAQWTTPDASQNINNTNTGNVGVGTTTPSYRLDVVAPNPWVARFRKTDATNGGIIIDSATGYNPNLAFSVNGAFKWYLNNNTTSGDALQFWESTGTYPRFTFTQAGYLGIGTTSPSAPISVALNSGGTTNTMALFDTANELGTTFPNLVFQRSRGTQTSRTAVVSGDRLGGFAFRGYGATGFNMNNDNAAVRGYAAENFTDTAQGTYLTFETTPTGTAARTEKLRILANGSVGIGTTSPVFDANAARYLTLDGGSGVIGSIGAAGGTANASTPVGQVAFINSSLGTTEKRLATIVGSTDAATNSGVLDIYTASAGAFSIPRLRITSGGNIGIGTISPGYRLDVQGGALNSSGGLCIAGDCKTAWSQVGGGSSQWTTSGANIYYNSGNVGIGTATPSQKLDINGNLNIQGGTTFFRQSSGLAGGEGAYVSMGATVNNEASFALNVYRAGTYTNRLSVNNFGQLLLQPADGNVGIGTTASPTAKLDVAGGINASGTISGGNIVAKYQDVAEWVQSSQELRAGTVVVLDQTKSNQVIASSQAYDTRVAGVISSQPGITLGEKGAGKVLVATTGRVKVKVDATSGPVKVGDLLVTSDKEGFAMKSEPISIGKRKMHAPGTLIGKALEPLDGGTGEILVLLSLQ